MFAEERKRRICELAAREGKLSVGQLETALGASPATIRRDLGELEGTGEIVRVHGGIMHPSLFRGERTFSQRQREQLDAKKAIARLAASFPERRASVFIDAGTTALEVGRELLRREDLTIFTHSLPLAMLAPTGKARVICIGGEVRPATLALVAGLSLEWLKNLYFDYAFLGASGLDQERGATTTELGEAVVKQKILGRSGEAYLVCDYTKWGCPESVVFADWGEFTGWVVDAKPPAAFTRKTKMKIFVHSAKERKLKP